MNSILRIVGIALAAALIPAAVAIYLLVFNASSRAQSVRALEMPKALSTTQKARRPAPDPRRSARAVPALAEKPARGPAFAIARLRGNSPVVMWRSPSRRLLRTVGPETEFGSPLVLSVVKRRAGWLGVSTPDLSNGRLGWIRRDPRQVQVYWTKYSLHADLSARTLSVHYGDDSLDRFVVTVGAPGSETPIGRFAITDAISFGSSPYYGCCALALSGRQTRLPASWLGGDRIAIHGTDGPVGDAASHGCIRATNAAMRTLFRRVPLGTPVFVRQ